MMLEVFRRDFPPDHLQRSEGSLGIDEPADPFVREFFRNLGGHSFRGGLYRTVHLADLAQWTDRILVAFPQYKGKVTCFGYDWLGSAFALDSQRLVDGQLGVLMFEPGTGKVLKIPSNLQTFHEVGLMKFGEAALAMSFYEKWIASGGSRPAYAQCIGYKRPLFLNGKDDVSNLEVSDIDVYWNIMGQLIPKARGLAVGTPVRVQID